MVGTTKKDDDGSFLIIDNSIKAESLPDTAVQLFEATPVESIQEVAPVSEISFFSEEKGTSEVENSVVFEDSEVESTSENIEITPLESATKEPLVSVQEVNIETLPEITSVAMVEEVAQVSEIRSEASDIYAPIRTALTEYENMLSGLMKDAQVGDQEVIDCNARVAEAKAEAKKALERRKSLDAGINQVKQMKESLALQLK